MDFRKPALTNRFDPCTPGFPIRKSWILRESESSDDILWDCLIDSDQNPKPPLSHPTSFANIEQFNRYLRSQRSSSSSMAHKTIVRIDTKGRVYRHPLDFGKRRLHNSSTHKLSDKDATSDSRPSVNPLSRS